MEHRRRVLGVELRTDEPLLSGDLNDLNESAFRVCTDALHTGLFVFFDVIAVEFVAIVLEP